MTFHHLVYSTLTALLLCSAPASAISDPPGEETPTPPTAEDLAMSGDDGVGGIESGVGEVLLEDSTVPLVPVMSDDDLGGGGSSEAPDADPETTPAEFPWTSLGEGLAGGGGTAPRLTATGQLKPNQRVTVSITNGRSSSVIILVVGDSVANLPFMGGTLVPTPQFIIAGLPLDGLGNFEMNFRVAENLPEELTLITQAFILDPEAPLGYSATNAVLVSTQP